MDTRLRRKQSLFHGSLSSPLAPHWFREAIQTCIEKGLRQAGFETDSLKLVKALSSESPIAEIYGIVADIICLSSASELSPSRGFIVVKTEMPFLLESKLCGMMNLL